MPVCVDVTVLIHVLIGGRVLRDLDALYNDEHCDPDQLEAGPDSEDEGPCVAHDDVAGRAPAYEVASI